MKLYQTTLKYTSYAWENIPKTVWFCSDDFEDFVLNHFDIDLSADVSILNKKKKLVLSVYNTDSKKGRAQIKLRNEYIYDYKYDTNYALDTETYTEFLCNPAIKDFLHKDLYVDVKIVGE